MTWASLEDKGTLLISASWSFSVSILCCCMQLTCAQGASIRIVPSLPNGIVGGNATLTIQGLSEEPLMYTWYRNSIEESNMILSYIVQSGEQIPSDIKQKVLPDGSLFIPDLTFGDAGLYIVHIINSSGLFAVTAQGNLTVNEEGDNSSSRWKFFILGLIIFVVILLGFIIYLFIRRREGQAHSARSPNGIASHHLDLNTQRLLAMV